MIVTLGGCSILGKPLEPTTPEVTIEPPASVTPKVSIPKPPPAPVIVVETVKPLDVAIIISRDIENHHIIHHKIEQLINQEKGNVKPFYLYQQSSDEIIEQITQTQHQQVVAIGLEAAKAATMLQQIPVIFCQVYNYQDHDLVSEYIKGVSLVPAIDQQFKAWKTTLPTLKQVGIITGSGKQAFIDSAIQSAAAHDITLISRVVNNDKEMWNEFRHLTPQVDGFWLLPDNRILSKRTLRSIMSYSAKHTTPLFTINGLLLQAGVAISSSQVGNDVANKVVTRLLSITANNTIPGPDIEPLGQARTLVNTQTTKRFNLLIPKGYLSINLERWPSPQVNATLAQ